MLANTNVKGIVHGCNVVRDFSSDKALRAKALQKEKAIRDEISALKQAMQQGENNIIAKMRKSGMTEEQIQKILAVS